MTPRKCSRHELRKGELADSPRYVQALMDSETCLRCRAWTLVARVAYHIYLVRQRYTQCPACMGSGFADRLSKDPPKSECVVCSGTGRKGRRKDPRGGRRAPGS